MLTDHSETIRALADITDEGLFERLATDVLRQAEPHLYGNLSTPGINPAGKTKRSPVDGIGFVTSENSRMVTAHHTTSALRDLRSKWLNDSINRTKTRSKPTTPLGDIIKTSLLVKQERERTPDLTVTLALTTNLEPSEDLIRDVQAAANLHRITIDVWSGSRIAHYLDNTPDGQWLRRKYLKITQERISAALLAELSRASLEAFNPMTTAENFIQREFDEVVARKSPVPLAFFVGESGFGKSIGCYRFLQRHINSGGYGLVLSHQTLGVWQTLDQAIDAELRKLHPSLEPSAGGKARALCSPEKPLVVMLEDVNWADRPSLLLERLIGWSASETNTTARFNWRVLCPVWPRTIASISSEARKRLDELSVTVRRFTDNEARQAIKQRARLARAKINDLTAARIAEALGNDPLLIGLYDFGTKQDPSTVIETFVSNSLERLSAGSGSFTFTEYQEALRELATAMLVRRRIDPTGRDVGEWFRGQSERLAALRQITRLGEIVRLQIIDQVEHLRFRHDRVRAWLFAKAMAELMRSNVDEAPIGEPFFADVIGAALVYRDIPLQVVERVRRQNPLALFHALKIFQEPQTEVHKAAVEAIYGWLQEDATHKRGNRSLRWTALDVLGDTESSHVLPICNHFKDRTWGLIRARFLNGDVPAGVHLCLKVRFGSNAPWRDRQIEHARHRFGSNMIGQLSELLCKKNIEDETRIGALRLAGHLGEPSLGKAVRKSWLNDKKRKQHLADYLWAAAQCCGDKPAKLLRPICAAWAKLSNRRSKHGLAPREKLGVHGLSWAFSDVLSAPTARYFVSRARKKDLRLPIMWMLRGVNQPEAIAFIVRILAHHSRSGGGYWTLPGNEEREWERRQFELGKPMSDISRQELLHMWKGGRKDKHVRRSAFRLWAATIAENDLATLRQADDNHLSDLVLWARIKRHDVTAIPAFIEKLRTDDSGYWWQLGRDFWNEDLTIALEEELWRRGQTVERQWNSDYHSDWIVAELLVRLTPERAEDLMQKHWEHLRFSFEFIGAALSIATPSTCSLAKEAVSACPDPHSLFKFAYDNLYPQHKTGPGVNRLEQVEAYLPYLDYLDDHAIYTLWDTCNRLGWFAFRRSHLDSRLKETNRNHTILNPANFFEQLDSALKRSGVDWADFFIRRYVEQTDRVEEVLSLLEQWLKERRTIAAFDFVAAVLRHVGAPSNLELLRVAGVEPIDDVEEIRRDTFFAVARRSLN